MGVNGISGFQQYSNYVKSQNGTGVSRNTTIPFGQAEPKEEKKGNGALIIGGLGVLALGLIFRKNISKYLGLGEAAAKGAVNEASGLTKAAEKATTEAETAVAGGAGKVATDVKPAVSTEVKAASESPKPEPVVPGVKPQPTVADFVKESEQAIIKAKANVEQLISDVNPDIASFERQAKSLASHLAENKKSFVNKMNEYETATGALTKLKSAPNWKSPEYHTAVSEAERQCKLTEWGLQSTQQQRQEFLDTRARIMEKVQALQKKLSSDITTVMEPVTGAVQKAGESASSSPVTEEAFSKISASALQVPDLLLNGPLAKLIEIEKQLGTLSV